MLCALTVRTLKPGTFDEFREAFLSGMDPQSPPAGWVRFDMLRNSDKPEEVICFGFFDGSLEELRSNEADMGYEAQMAKVAPFVDAVGTDGLFEVVEDYAAAPA